MSITSSLLGQLQHRLVSTPIEPCPRKSWETLHLCPIACMPLITLTRPASSTPPPGGEWGFLLSPPSFQRMTANVLCVICPRNVLITREYRRPHEGIRAASDNPFHRPVEGSLNSWVPGRVCPLWSVCLPVNPVIWRHVPPSQLLKALRVFLSPVAGVHG